MKGWCERHPDYHPDAKDGKQLKNLLLRERGVTVEFLMALLDGAVAKNGWHRKVTGTIASFCSNFNALKADVKVVTAGSDRKKLERQLEAVHLALPHVVDFVDQKEKFAEITRLERAIAGCR